MENQTNQSGENTEEQIDGQFNEEKKMSINQVKLDQYIEQLRLDQNLPFGLISAFIASIAGASVWAVITVSTEYQIGYMAVAVGFLVGYVLRYTGKGIDKIFGISGAILALFGCLLGNLLSIIGFVANSEGLGYFETMSLIDYAVVPEIMMETFSPMDLLFYGIAIYEGYKFSFRKITEEEIIDNAAE